MSDLSFTQRAFREALSSFATGVTIVTACGPGDEPVGMTASSFNSVSMDPPLVLWSVTKAARSAPVFKAAQHFSIHVLSSDQVGISNLFATSGADKFSDLDWAFDQRKVPVIKGAVTRFDCRTWAIYEGGDHWIIVGEVTKLTSEDREALVFGGGSYATITPMRSSDPAVDSQLDAASPIDSLIIYQLARAYRQLGFEFHKTVRNEGLSVPEWRVLASLHGTVTRSFDDLVARTFVERKSLRDMLTDMAAQGLCAVSPDGQKISGTEKGHARVAALFDLGHRIEGEALAGLPRTARDDLIEMLRQIITNTDDG